MGKPIKDRGIHWQEAYGDKSAWLKDEFSKQVGKGSYYRWEGHDSTTGNDYYVVVSPGYSKKKGYHFFAGIRKMPAKDGASGKKFKFLREALSYSIDTWGVPPPIEKPAKEYGIVDIQGKSIFEEIMHKDTKKASRKRHIIIASDSIQKQAMAVGQMNPNMTNWQGGMMTTGKRVLKHRLMFAVLMASMRKPGTLFLPDTLRRRAIDATNVGAHPIRVHATGKLITSEDPHPHHGEAKNSYKYSTAVPPAEEEFNTVVQNGIVKKGDLFKPSRNGKKLLATIPPIFEENQGDQGAEGRGFKRYTLTRMRDIPYINYELPFAAQSHTFTNEEIEFFRRRGITVSLQPRATGRSTSINYNCRVPRVKINETDWTIKEFEAYLKKEPLPREAEAPPASPEIANRPKIDIMKISRIKDTMQRNAHKIMMFRHELEKGGLDPNRYPVLFRGKPVKNPDGTAKVLNIGEDMPLYEELEGVKGMHRMLTYDPYGFPLGIMTRTRGKKVQLHAESDTEEGKLPDSKFLLKRSNVALKMYEAGIPGSELLFRGRPPMEFLPQGVTWQTATPEQKSVAFKRAVHGIGADGKIVYKTDNAGNPVLDSKGYKVRAIDEEVKRAKQVREAPENMPRIKAATAQLKQKLSRGEIQLGRNDFAHPSSCVPEYEEYKQERPLTNQWGMPMLVDEERSTRDENGKIVNLVMRPYTQADYDAGKKIGREEIDISATHDFQVKSIADKKYGRIYDPEKGEEIFKEIPEAENRFVKGLPVVLPSNQTSSFFDFQGINPQRQSDTAGSEWNLYDAEALHEPIPGNTMEIIIELPHFFRAGDPRQTLRMAKRGVQGWTVMVENHGLKKVVGEDGTVKLSTRNKAPVPVVTADLEKGKRDRRREYKVPKYTMRNGVMVHETDASGKPVMVDVSEAGFKVKYNLQGKKNFFEYFPQAVEFCRAVFGSNNPFDAWSENMIGPIPNSGIQDIVAALTSSETALNMYMELSRQGQFNEEKTQLIKPNEVVQLDAEQTELVKFGEVISSTLRELTKDDPVQPLSPEEEGEGVDEEEDEENSKLVIPRMFYAMAAKMNTEMARAASNPHEAEAIMNDLFGVYEKDEIYGVKRRTPTGEVEWVKDDSGYTETFPYRRSAYEWLQSHHPGDASYSIEKIPAEGPLPTAPSLIENLGATDPNALATSAIGRTKEAVIGKQTLLSVMEDNLTEGEVDESGRIRSAEEAEPEVPAEAEEPAAPEEADPFADFTAPEEAQPAEPEIAEPAPPEEAEPAVPVEEPAAAVPAVEEPAVPQSVPEAEPDPFADFMAPSTSEPAPQAPAAPPTPEPVMAPAAAPAPAPAAPAAPAAPTLPSIPLPARPKRRKSELNVKNPKQGALIQKLVALANRYDEEGKTEEADKVDKLIEYALERINRSGS